MNRIAHFGTFDVDNYGDLLFPHLAEFRLPHYNWEHISPTSNQTVFIDSKPIKSFDNARNSKFKAVVIGGGNILHFLPNKNTVYRNKKGFAYADLWIGASKIAMEQRIPYVFNAPGISKVITNSLHKKIAFSTFKYSNYVSFRERLSNEIAQRCSNHKTDKKFISHIIPDTAFDIDRMWPTVKDQDSKYICVNLNKRYHKPIKITAIRLDEISIELKMPIKFIIIGDCHGDKAFTEKVSNNMKTNHKIIESNGLKKIAHTIGQSSYFFGSSMHGFITALSYGVPSFLVLNKSPLHKFKGLLEITNLNQNIICDSFCEVQQSINFPAILKREVKQKIQFELDNHWEKIDEIIKRGAFLGTSQSVLRFQHLLNLQKSYNKILKKMSLIK